MAPRNGLRGHVTVPFFFNAHHSSLSFVLRDPQRRAAALASPLLYPASVPLHLPTAGEVELPISPLCGEAAALLTGLLQLG